MKKVKSYTAQFKIVGPKNPSQNSNTQSALGMQSTFGTQSAFGKQAKTTKKTLSKQNQEFINNISPSGIKQFFS